MMKAYLSVTPILDFEHNSIQLLIERRAWNRLSEKKRIQVIYNFVRDEVLFGYNRQDALKASEILADGYGQCNTKSTLLMALLRATGIPTRLHGFTIEKPLQKGAIPGIWYLLSPKNILHTWVEVLYEGNWYHLEGVILDKQYLKRLQKMFEGHSGAFCGYGAYTGLLASPVIDWDENHTYIQEKGINQDFGLYDTPDDFYRDYGQEMGFVKNLLFQNFGRKQINSNVRRIRGC